MSDVDDILNRDELLKPDIVTLLRLDDPCDLQKLYKKADLIRKQYMGDTVHMRGIIEISNYCARWCTYCGINAANNTLKRYRMSVDEIIDTVRKAHCLGYKTVVIQSGEDNFYTIDLIEDIISRICSQ